ncbi:MAG TPA: hypothetical protein VK671_15135, partial [Mucilaginibacter sp.]|nr:hypothetical protein [Mucilaginibacter sp.]
MKRSYLIIVFVLLSNLLHAQDYFSDRNANGSPIILNSHGSNQLLFSANVDVSDKSSLKANIFKQYWLNKDSYTAMVNKNNDTVPRNKNFLGWGLSTKASTTNGLGSVFGSGKLNPGFAGSGYLAFSNYSWVKPKGGTGTTFSSLAIILTGTLSYTNHQFFDPSQAFGKQLTSNSFSGTSGSLSFVKELHPSKDNWYVGASFTVGRQSNYDQLTTVLIKNDSSINNNNSTRVVEQINQKGDVYAIGKYKEYTNYNIRLNACFVPGDLNSSIGFLLYPSIDLSSAYSAKYNIGFSFS